MSIRQCRIATTFFCRMFGCILQVTIRVLAVLGVGVWWRGR